MPLTPNDLNQITRSTLGHYESQAVSYWEGTQDHDVLQNINALLSYIEESPPLSPPFTILDFGCGPGRDLMTFAKLGHRAIGLDGSAAFVKMAQAHSGCEVWRQDFLALDLPPSKFDGVFANASLQHIPAQELPRVLRALHASLKPRGVLFASIPHGDDREGWNNERYSCYHSPARWQALVAAAGFERLQMFYRPVNAPVEEQRWLASAWRKRES
jgi:SAM-dependent methyltransferase